jgi:hypothetical protein
MNDLSPNCQDKLKEFFELGLQQGCPKEQLLNFAHARITRAALSTIGRAKSDFLCAAFGL